MKTKLENAAKGYVEFVCMPDNGDLYDGPYEIGYVHVEDFVVKTDFEKDKIYYTERWVSYRFYNYDGYLKKGRETGYKTRKEALDDMYKMIQDEKGW